MPVLTINYFGQLGKNSQGNPIPVGVMYVDGVSYPSVLGTGVYHITVSPGIHKIWCNDSIFDIEVYSDPGTSAYARIQSNGYTKSKQNGFWFDTITGYIEPTYVIPVQKCTFPWDGFAITLTSSGDNIYDLKGNLVATTVDLSAHPTYYLINSLWPYYDINTNTMNISRALPSSCPVTAKSVIVTAINKKTLTGIMSIFDYDRLSTSKITFVSGGPSYQGSSFFTSEIDSNLIPTLTAESVLSFLSSNSNPINPPVPYTIFQPGQQSIDVLTNDVAATSAYIQTAISTGSIITPSTAATIPGVTSVIGSPPPKLVTGEQFLLVLPSGKSKQFTLDVSDFDLLVAELSGSTNRIMNIMSAQVVTLDTILDVFNFINAPSQPGPTTPPPPGPIIPPPPGQTPGPSQAIVLSKGEKVLLVGGVVSGIVIIVSAFFIKSNHRSKGT